MNSMFSLEIIRYSEKILSDYWVSVYLCVKLTFLSTEIMGDILQYVTTLKLQQLCKQGIIIFLIKRNWDTEKLRMISNVQQLIYLPDLNLIGSGYKDHAYDPMRILLNPVC